MASEKPGLATLSQTKKEASDLSRFELKDIAFDEKEISNAVLESLFRYTEFLE